MHQTKYAFEHTGIKVEIRNRKKNHWKSSYMWINILLKSYKSKKKTKNQKEILNWMKIKSKNYQNLWNAAKALSKGKLIAVDIQNRKKNSLNQ